MTAKEYLKTYQGEKKEADAIEARIMELKRKKKRVKAVSHTGVPIGTYVVNTSVPIGYR